MTLKGGFHSKGKSLTRRPQQYPINLMTDQPRQCNLSVYASFGHVS